MNTSSRTLRRGLVALATAVLALVSLVPPAGAAEVAGTDAVGDVPYDRGNITSFRAIHRSNNVDLRVRTRRGGQPVNFWNRQSYIRWRINTDADAMPEYYADLRVVTGADTVFVGQVRYANQDLVPGCQGQQYVNNPEKLVTAVSNEYRFQFLRGCIGAATSFRARATFRWDNGAPNVGPVYTDYAPGNGPTVPVVSG